MTDTRRTVLWVIFSLSLFLIWDAWMRHNGQPSFLSPAPRPVAAASAPAAGGATPPLATGVPGVPASGVATGVPGTTTVPVAASASASVPIAAERVVATTDVVKATLDARGGELLRLELLRHADALHPDQHEVLFDASAERLYVAQTGLVPAAGGSGLPNHHTVMRLLPGPRELAAGSDALQIAFESDDVGGVKLRKTYTFTRGSYVVDVRHDVTNDSGQAVDPRLYFQLVRDGNALPGSSNFFGTSTYTGMAMYTDAKRFQKIDFPSVEKRAAADKPAHETAGDNGWVAMVQHYFASAWLVDPAGGAKVPREYFTTKGDVQNPVTGGTAHVYSVGMLVPLGAIAPGQTKSFDAKLFAGPQEEDKLSVLAPGLELVKDYGIFKILAEPLFWLLTQIHKILGNWGWSIVGLVVLLKIAFYWLNATAYRLDGRR